MSVFEQLEAIVHDNYPEFENVETALSTIGSAPSFSVAVLDNGKVISKCYSIVGDTVDTLFQACSVSKAINALGVMKLIEKGPLKLDSTVADFLPEHLLNLLLSGSPKSLGLLVRGITVKQLLSHTSGLGVESFIGYSSPNKVPTADQILSGVPSANSLRICLESLPGHSFSYSGGGITILQWMVEKASRLPYAQYMHEAVLVPLGMTHSYFGEPPASPGTSVARAFYNQFTLADSDHHIMPELAAAGLWSTPTDLLKAVMAVQKSLQGGVHGAFLHKPTAEMMLNVVSEEMALSWMRPDDVTFMHTGSNYPGFRAELYGYAHLDEDATDVPLNCGFCIMANSSNTASFDVVWKMAKAITAGKKWPLQGDSDVERVQPFRPLKAGGTEHWKGWIGRWEVEDDDTGSSKIYRLEAGDGSKPVLFYGLVGPIAMLRTVVDDEFELEGVQMKVELTEKGQTKGILVTSGLSGKSVELVKLQ